MRYRNGKTPQGSTPRRSAIAEAAALRRGFIDDAAFEPPPQVAGDAPPTRPSAHAEAAALRWYEQHLD